MTLLTKETRENINNLPADTAPALNAAVFSNMRALMLQMAAI
jgi:hypothetical protein